MLIYVILVYVKKKGLRSIAKSIKLPINILGMRIGCNRISLIDSGRAQNRNTVTELIKFRRYIR